MPEELHSTSEGRGFESRPAANKLLWQDSSGVEHRKRISPAPSCPPYPLFTAHGVAADLYGVFDYFGQIRFPVLQRFETGFIQTRDRVFGRTRDLHRHEQGENPLVFQMVQPRPSVYQRRRAFGGTNHP